MSTNDKSEHTIAEDERPRKGSVFSRIGSVAGRKGSLDVPQETVAEYFEEVTAQEHALTFRQALKTERGVLLWAFIIGMAALSWGFDAQVNGGALGIAQFRLDFGEMYKGQAVLPAKWQTAFNVMSSVGQFFGGIGSGFVADRIGRKWTLWLGSWVLIIGIIMEVVATTRGVFVTAKFILGIALGFYLSMAPAYCSEISPVVLRGITTAGVSLAIVIGQLVSNGAIKGFGELTTRWAYRGPFCVQFFLPAFLLCVVPFAPESPWYLVRKERYDDARKSLTRLHGNDGAGVEAQLSHISKSIQLESEEQANATFLDCFRGTDLRRTIITVGVFCCQHLSGIIFVLGYSTYFFQLAGLPLAQTFSLGVGVTACGVAGNVSSWWLVNSVGRRLVMLAGMVIVTIILFLIGIFDVAGTPGAAWGQASVTVLYSFFWFATIGAMAYVTLGEASSTRLRSKTVGLTTVTQSLWGLIMNFAIPYAVNPDQANLKGKVGFILGGTSLASTIWIYFCVPELKGLTFSEIDERFKRKIKTRAFQKKFDESTF